MKIFSVLILFIGMTINCAAYYAAPENPDEYEFPLSSEPGVSDSDSEDDPPPIELPPGRHRVPSMMLVCTISQETGVTISGNDIADAFISYEAYDTAGACIAIFSDEQSFVDFIFSGIHGEFQIRFKTDSASYLGYIEMREQE